MRQPDTCLIRGKGSGKRGIHIPYNDNKRRLKVEHQLLQLHHNSRHLGVSRSGWNIQEKIGGKAKLLEKNIGHLVIGMLARMHYADLQLRVTCGYLFKTSHLNKIRPGAYDYQDLFFQLLSFSTSSK